MQPFLRRVGMSAQEFELYLLEVEKLVCDDEPELGMRGVDAA